MATSSQLPTRPNIATLRKTVLTPATISRAMLDHIKRCPLHSPICEMKALDQADDKRLDCIIKLGRELKAARSKSS